MNTWTLIFRAEGDGPPTAVRVRRLLKAALRAYGLRCVRIGEAEELEIVHPSPKGIVEKQNDRTQQNDR